jgi:hypothetical protein
MEKLVSVTILTRDRQKVSKKLNDFLTSKGHLIMSRLGVNVQKNCLDHCPGMIVLILKTDDDNIDLFIKGLEEIGDLEFKYNIFEE